MSLVVSLTTRKQGTPLLNLKGSVITNDIETSDNMRVPLVPLDADEDIELATAGSSPPPFNNVLFYSVTVVFLICAYSLAVIVSDLGLVLKVVGATGSTCVTYVLPGLIYVYTIKERHTKRYFAMLQALLGAVIVPVALYIIFAPSHTNSS